MMKCSVHKLLILCAACIISPNQFAQDPQNANPETGRKQCLVKEEGWIIPGMEYFDRALLLSRNRVTLQGTNIQVSRISLTRAPGESLPPHPVKVPFAREGKDEYTDMEVVGERLIRYDVAGKTFCYLVTVQPVEYDPAEKSLRATGKEHNYAYYDENGDGVFETMEPANMIEDHPDEWRVRLPDWVVKR